MSQCRAAFKHITFEPQTNFSPLIPSLVLFVPVKGRILILGVRLAASPPLYPSPHFPVLLKGSGNLGSPPALTTGAPQSSALSLVWNTNVLTAFAACSPHLSLPSVCLAFLSACQLGTARCRSREISQGTRVASSLLPWCEKE